MLAAMLARKESDYNLDKVDINIINPGKCQTNAGWDNWQIGFVNKLCAIKGAAKILFKYIVRPELDKTMSCSSTMTRQDVTRCH